MKDLNASIVIYKNPGKIRPKNYAKLFSGDRRFNLNYFRADCEPAYFNQGTFRNLLKSEA